MQCKEQTMMEQATETQQLREQINWYLDRIEQEPNPVRLLKLVHLSAWRVFVTGKLSG